MCKMAHFGNCDPETADQEYCIFHKPNKSEEEAREFYRKFLERFKPKVEEIEVDGEKVKRLVFEEPVDAKGFVFPEIPDTAIEYIDNEGNEWNQKFSFENAVFKREINLSNSMFRSNVYFNFHDVTFYGVLKLHKIIVYPGLDFSGSTFGENVEIVTDSPTGILIFDDCVFRKELILIESTLEAILGENIKFTKTGLTLWQSKLQNVILKNINASFLGMNDCIIGKEFVITDSEIGAGDFSGSQFTGFFEMHKCKIDEANFSELYVGLRCNFENTILMNNSDFSATTFNGYVYFKDSIFKGDVSFEGTSFNEPVSFQGKPKNEKFKFYGKLDFSHVDIRKGIDINVPSEWFKLPEAEIEARRVQRLSFEKEGKRDEADRMFVLEMRAKRRARIKNAQSAWDKAKAHTHNFFEWLFADLSSRYGTDWIRLFMVSLFVVIGNAVPYTIWSKLIDGFPKTSNIAVRFANALYYSLVTFTTLGYGDMHPTGWLKALSAVEALTGAVFMALIVAVIARKWMR